MKNKDIFIFIFIFIICGLFSIFIGMDRMWDVRNYQIYNPWAFLNNRITYDIMPAGIQSFFSPLIHVPYLLMVQYLNPYPELVTFLMGFGAALLIFTTYKLSQHIFKRDKICLPIICMILTSGMAVVYNNVGMINQDMLISALGLIALLMVFKAFEYKNSELKYIILAGFTIGIACGLKLSATCYAVPLTVCLLLYSKKFQNPAKIFISYIIAAAASFLLINGFWMYKLYATFGNPFMPYFNSIFKSSIINADNVYSIDFQKIKLPVYANFIFPFIIKGEYWLKFLYVIFILNIFTIPFFNKNKFEEQHKFNIMYYDFSLLFVALCYFYWVYLLLRNIRYIIFFAGLIPIITIIFIVKIAFLMSENIDRIKQIQKNKTIIIKIVSLILLFTSTFLIFYPGIKNYNRRIPVRYSPYVLDIENVQIPNNSVVIIMSGNSFLAPFQNPTSKYIYLNYPPHTKKNFQLFKPQHNQKIKNLFMRNHDKIFFLGQIDLSKHKNINPKDTETILKSGSSKKIKKLSDIEIIIYELYKYGLNAGSATCREIQTNVYLTPFFVCKLDLR